MKSGLRPVPGWSLALAVTGAHLSLGHLIAYNIIVGSGVSWQALLLYTLLSLWGAVFAWNRMNLTLTRTLAALLLNALTAGTALHLMRARRAGAGVRELALASLFTAATAGLGVAVISLWASRLERAGLLEDTFTP